MSTRQDVIARSITEAILRPEDRRNSVLGRIPAFFYSTPILQRIEKDLFVALRGVWGLDEQKYRASFDPSHASEGQKHALKVMGDMGYSGSTFFRTQDNEYIVKSIPRHFEHSFAKELLIPYAEYLRAQPESLLVRITDFLQHSHYSIGSILGLAPSHHIVMENIKRGQQDGASDGGSKWETFDLKETTRTALTTSQPMSFFYPERDIAGGLLSSEATKSKLADDFDDKIYLTLDAAEHFKGQLQKDTAFLAKHNAVDYSLFLVRIPVNADATGHSSANHKRRQNWRTGISSSNHKYEYRAVILDFFWAKHKVHAQAMTGLVNTYNLIDRKGPMSITTTSPEYRSRFLKMCEEMIEIQQS